MVVGRFTGRSLRRPRRAHAPRPASANSNGWAVGTMRKQAYHRSHFGSRYTLGLLRLRKPFLGAKLVSLPSMAMTLLACLGRDTALAARCPLDRSSARVQPLSDSLAEWSKALASGASPQGRGFKPHSCHLRTPLVSQALNPTARQTLNSKIPTPEHRGNPKF